MTLSGGEKEMDVRVSVVEPICLQLLRSSLSGPAMVVVVADRIPMWEPKAGRGTAPAPGA